LLRLRAGHRHTATLRSIFNGKPVEQVVRIRQLVARQQRFVAQPVGQQPPARRDEGRRIVVAARQQQQQQQEKQQRPLGKLEQLQQQPLTLREGPE
jgi:hypothetical protein